MRDIRNIVIHCTAGSQRQTVADIVRYHTGPKSQGYLGWSVAGYHYIVTPDGRVVAVVPEDQPSNGVRGHNRDSIHIAYIGGVDTSRPGLPAVDNRTAAQKRALLALLKELRQRYPKARITGHRDIASTDSNHNGIIDQWERVKECPSFDAEKEYKDI